MTTDNHRDSPINERALDEGLLETFRLLTLQRVVLRRRGLHHAE